MEIFFFAGIVLLLVILIVLVLKKNTDSSAGPAYNKEVETLKIELARSQQREQSLLEERLMLKNELDKERENLLVAERSLESTRSFYEAQLDKFQEQKNEIAEIKRQFNNEFQVIANKILEEKTQKFTETNHRSLGLILDPLKEKIKLFEEKVDKNYNQEAAERNSLKGVVLQLVEQSLKIKDEANSLTKACLLYTSPSPRD